LQTIASMLTSERRFFELARPGLTDIRMSSWMGMLAPNSDSQYVPGGVDLPIVSIPLQWSCSHETDGAFNGHLSGFHSKPQN
jgi:hypothetical protein